MLHYQLHQNVQPKPRAFVQETFAHLKAIRHIDSLEIGDTVKANNQYDDNVPALYLSPGKSPDDVLNLLVDLLQRDGRAAEADTLRHVLDLSVLDHELGGLGLSSVFASGSWDCTPEDIEKVLFLIEAWLEALNSAERSPKLNDPVTGQVQGRRPMTVTEKIFTHHATRTPNAEGLRPGDFVRVTVDWVIASELSWVGMKHSLESIGRKPTVWRNDRFWLAGDHVVEPRTYDQPQVRELLDGLKEAKKSFKMTDNQGANYTIMHTQFVRERAEPGMLIVGSDSHTCSAGAVGCLAIGLGAADVMMALATGETWFKVPETIHVHLINKPAWYIRGKDTVLYILQQLKRNTVAADRIVEFSGPGASYLSCDARFAIANMCTELGGITGIFAPDKITHSYIDSRVRKANRSSSLYFQADDDAEYAETFDIDLAKIEPFIALYPSPDNVVPVSERHDMKFDGCFIGACTTTEEELILAALVLKTGMEQGLEMTPGKRQVVPGSLPIVRKLRSLGLLELYERAGFVRTAPGCSLCIAMGADKAAAGEIWLSSQNRNFKNRMGKGSYGNICSAATVAASSFSMRLTDPRPLLEKMDQQEYASMLKSSGEKREHNRQFEPQSNGTSITFVEPHIAFESGEDRVMANGDSNNDAPESSTVVKGKAYVLGDFVDTDAIIPADKILGCLTDKDLAEHCLEYTNPDFREKVQSGYNIVIAGKAFGCGSSREEAPRALKGLGVQCVVARSYSFIYGRNQPTIALLGIIIDDDDFYLQVETGVEIEVDVSNRIVRVSGRDFTFALKEMELSLIRNQGLAQAFLKHGNEVFAALCGGEKKPKTQETNMKSVDAHLEGLDRQRGRETLAW